jgi:hypothetical protein
MGGSVFIAFDLQAADQAKSCTKMASKSQCPLQKKSHKKVAKRFQFEFETTLSTTEKIEASGLNLSVVNHFLNSCFISTVILQPKTSGIPPPLLRKPTLSLLQSYLI